MSDLMQNPFYTNPCSEVTEDHARHVIVHQYVACLRISSTWVVPANDSLVWLDTPALVDILVGSLLWNPEFGYFRVMSFDKQANRVKVQRAIHSSTAVPGTVVPACSQFILTPDNL